MTKADWEITRGAAPILATAIHNGNQVREELKKRMILADASRLREEDPYTGRWTTIAENRIILNTSRFEVDLNRPREKAVYARPEDAWGLNIWDKNLEPEVVEGSLTKYDRFYTELKVILDELQSQFGRFVVYDIHSYNHRRNGADAPPEPVEANPEVNLGTGTLDKTRWGKAATAFMDTIRDFDYDGRHLDVRENVKFKGGWLSTWIHENYPETGLCLAVEFKKFFMDEWTGEYFEEDMVRVEKALRSTIEPVTKAAGLNLP
ncbi:MAG: N-formylglutamate amidohydrolase [Candidatus Obscuribacterales bacterium]|nr:N-formylglutamate amidohydrolase [Cyanobacteria bacterium HKST-UBA01]MCB9471461.1 N-formylglutamate amidohydrolase [Candidatus Obscuribacterales bacterium]